jgi:energy-coupling factor transport system permease protein
MIKDYPGKYIPGDTPLHKIPAGVKLWGMLALVLAAALVRSPVAVGCLVAINIILGLMSAGKKPRLMWVDIRLLLFQVPVVILLYYWRYGRDSLGLGLLVGLKVIMAVYPALLLQRTTDPGGMLAALRRVLPAKLAFLMIVGLRFLPLMIKEAKAIHHAQTLRGAQVSAKSLRTRQGFKDFVDCLMVPLVRRIGRLSDEIAMAAQIKGVGAGTSKNRKPNQSR